MKSTAALAEARKKLADAAAFVRKTLDENPGKAVADLGEKFAAAQKDMADAGAQISLHRERVEVETSCADAFEPGSAAPMAGALDVTQDQVAEAVQRSRPRAKGRSHWGAERGPVDAPTHKRGFNTYLRHGATAFKIGFQSIGEGPQNKLMTSSGELGGFLVPPDFRTELISDSASQSIIMRLARRIPTTTNEATFPTIQSDTTSPRIYRSGFRGAMRSEGEVGGVSYTYTEQNQPKFGQVNIPVHTWMPSVVLITPEQMEDSAIDVESILTSIGAETLALEMDSACLVNGTGSGEPRGIIAHSGVTVVTATAAASIDYNAYIDLIFGATGLPAQYRQGAVLAMNTATYAATLKLNDGNDRPLINVFTSPDTMYGYPIEFSEFLAVPASSAKVAIFGNFANYGVAERVDFRIQRLEEKFAPNIGILMRARFGGDVLRPAAFRILKCAA